MDGNAVGGWHSHFARMTDELRQRIKRSAIEYVNTQIANPTDEDIAFVEKLFTSVAEDVIQAVIAERRTLKHPPEHSPNCGHLYKEQTKC